MPYLKAAVVLLWLCLGLRAEGASIFQVNNSGEFSQIIDTNSAVLTTNAFIDTWLEGPTWIPSDGGYLVFCDQNTNYLRKLVLPTNVSIFLAPPTNTLFNGTILDAQERLIGAEAGSNGLKISMITNGIRVPLVTSCNGSNFYSPNDVAVKSDGTIWFTDPGYNSGFTKFHAGFAGGYYVYQFNPTNGNAGCRIVITNGIVRPNGLCFSPDESKLYVADSDGDQHHILVYSVSPSNTLTGGTVFANVNNGVPDGIHCDVDGRVWSSAGDGVHIFSPTNGHLIGKILFKRTANLCFGGSNYMTLFMTGQPLVTSLPVRVAGMPSVKKLKFTSKTNQVNLSWPAPSTGFGLEESGSLNPASTWSNSPLAIIVTNAQNVVTVNMSNSAKFYRLRLK